jgi:N-acetylmuramoyl-L-alanine amidase-like protein
VRNAGVCMLCLTAMSWLSAGGCQRAVVTAPEPRWPNGRVPAEMSRVPPQSDWKPNANTLPPLITGNPWKPSVPIRDWKHIVIHHTGSESGSIESIHASHLARKDKYGKNWLGIGYHFVIGNGRGMGDGEIEPTFRWRQQLHGAHAGNDEYNQHGIGICVVGNFDNHAPSSAQLLAVKQLVAVLKSEYRIGGNQVVGHREVRATACPGKHFPLSAISQLGDLPVFGQRGSDSDSDANLSPQFVQAEGRSEP